MKVLVTGGLGTIGRPLVTSLDSAGHEVWFCDIRHDSNPHYSRCDIGEFRQLEDLVKRVRPELVYHLAAEFGRRNGEEFYESVWRTNAVGTKNVIRLQERNHFRLVVASSSEVYGEYSGPLVESLPDRRVLRQLNDYAISKWVNELQVLNSIERFRTETVRIRIFNTYGPGEYYSPYRSVACIFVYRALHNLPFDVYTKHRRTSTYIDDCIAAIVSIADHFKPGEVYNICGDETHTTKRLSDIVLKETGANRKLARYKQIEMFNSLVKRGDNRKAKRDLHWRPTIGLEEGIHRTVAWQQRVYQDSLKNQFKLSNQLKARRN